MESKYVRNPYNYREKNELKLLHHHAYDEHAFRMGYPSGYLSGLSWGVYDHYGMRAREKRKGAYVVDIDNGH